MPPQGFSAQTTPTLSGKNRQYCGSDRVAQAASLSSVYPKALFFRECALSHHFSTSTIDMGGGMLRAILFAVLFASGGCDRYFDAVGQFVDAGAPAPDLEPSPVTDLSLDSAVEAITEADSAAPDLGIDIGADLSADSAASAFGDCEAVSIVFPSRINQGAFARVEFVTTNNSPVRMQCYAEVTVFEETPTTTVLQRVGYDKTLDPGQQATTFTTLDRTLPDGHYTVKGCVHAVGPPPTSDRVPRDSQPSNNCLEHPLTIIP